MKTFYIPEMHTAAIMNLKSCRTKYGDKYEANYKSLTEAKKARITAAFTALQAGSINIFYTQHTSNNRSGQPYTSVTAYHRSPKKAGFIQESHYHIIDGEILPDYDIQHENLKSVLDEGIKSGCYLTA